MNEVSKLLGLSVLVSLLGVSSAFAANDYFRCDRIVASNFDLIDKTAAGLDRVYPKELNIVIAADKSWAISQYGKHSNRKGAAIKNDIIRTPNGFMLDGTKLRTTGKVYVYFHKQGKKQNTPATYKCDKPKKTSWQPKD